MAVAPSWMTGLICRRWTVRGRQEPGTAGGRLGERLTAPAEDPQTYRATRASFAWR
jgi:hypothetical protein